MWLTGSVAPWHVGSSQTRARTRVPCIGRQILNHCATREAPPPFLHVVFLGGFVFSLGFCVFLGRGMFGAAEQREGEQEVPEVGDAQASG